MMINPTSVRATLGDAAGNATSNPSTDPAGFASLLRQTRVAPTPTVAAPTETKATTEPAPENDVQDDAPTAQEPDTASRTRTLKGRPRATDGAPVPTPDAKPSPDAKDARKADAAAGADTAEKCVAPETQLTAAQAPVDPSVMHWLAGLQRAAAGPADDATAGPDDQTAPVDTDTDAAESRGAARGSRTADSKAEAEADLKDRAAQGRTQFADAATVKPFAAALTEHGGVIEKPLYQGTDSVNAVAAAGAGTLAPAHAAGTDAPAAATVVVAAPVATPDFAQELGLRLSVLAKDGVHTAELHLNPADMGPVSVQIVMDGRQARVDFGADVAATRQAIEAGLPELASALRDAGFTLAGGGVSQHAGGRRSGSNSDQGTPDGQRARGIVVEDDLKRVAAAARRVVTNGGVDLFA